MSDNWTYRFEYVRCGKVSCRSCPHGPYWYRYQRRGAKVAKEYVGKVRPDQAGADATDRAGRRWDEFDDILAPGGLHLANALAVLALAGVPTEDQARSAFRVASMLYHPDRGGTERQMKAVNAAWEYLRRYYRWR